MDLSSKMITVKDYVLYCKKCPGVQDPRHFKIGISQLSSVRSRIATYQNAVGPVYEESFMRIWVGDENQIRLAEKSFKRHYKERIMSAEAGLSEWISNISLDEILEYVAELREEHFLKLNDAPEELQPLTMPLCEDLMAWYEDFLTIK